MSPELKKVQNWLQTEIAQRQRASLTLAVDSWEVYCRLRTEYNQLELVRQFVQRIADGEV